MSTGVVRSFVADQQRRFPAFSWRGCGCGKTPDNLFNRQTGFLWACRHVNCEEGRVSLLALVISMEGSDKIRVQGIGY